MCLHAPSFFSVHSNNIRSAACISVPPQHSFLLYGSVQTDAPPARILYSYVLRWRFICLCFNKKAKTSIICLYTFSLLQKGCVRVMIRWVCVRVFVSVCFGTIFLKRERKLNLCVIIMFFFARTLKMWYVPNEKHRNFSRMANVVQWWWSTKMLISIERERDVAASRKWTGSPIRKSLYLSVCRHAARMACRMGGARESTGRSSRAAEFFFLSSWSRLLPPF